ncbi:MAG: prepilin peptidase [Planctomycetes bacterium]|nr:prepilin peptidase [Planctomycetota bacterium]
MFEVGAALFGACIGSFLNVVIWRLPQEDPAKRSLGGRSHCPRCGAQIRWFDNVPVLSWLLLRGRARCCKNPIAARYPIVELLTGALFLLLAVQLPGGSVWSVDLAGVETIDLRGAATFALHALFLSMLVALSFIDFDTQLLPDALTKPGMVIGVVAGIWPGIVAPIAEDPAVSRALCTWLGSVVGLLVGGGVTWGVRALGTVVFKKDAMGFGDVKLMGMVGAFLGWKAALLTLALGCLFGSIVGGVMALRRGLGARIPFGPYLALGAIVSLFWQQDLIELLFRRWPDWQRENPGAQWLVLLAAAGSLFLMLVLVRRGRRSG